MEKFTNRLNPKAFTSLKNHNIKKRFNVWQEDKLTGTIVQSHIPSSDITLEGLIETVKGYQSFSDKCEGGKYTYHIDIEILIENSQGESLMEGEVAYAITVYPEVKDFFNVGLW